jgi:hypothetical protein
MTKGLALSLLIVVGVAAAPAVHAAPALKSERGRLQELIATLASSDYVLGEPDVDSRPYVDPTPVLHAFRHLAAALTWGDVQDAALEAAKLDYELVKFVDVNTKIKYYVLREDLGRVTARGWGSYIINPQGRINALVEVPHPLADAQTPEIGGAVFEQAGAKGFLLAGAHRLKADVPDLVDSVFHQVHMAWVGPTAAVAAWQIHGFASYKHEFPDGVNVIASTGDGVIRPEVAALDAKFEREGLVSYVFNKRPARSSANKRLNGDVPGVAFSSLAATTNEQGRQSRSLGGSFVHVELESQVRLDAEQAERAASVIAAAMSEPAGSRGPSSAATITVAAYAPEPPEPTAVDEPVAESAVDTIAETTTESDIGVQPASSAPGDSGAVDLARDAAPRPQRPDGSRARRPRKPTS